LIESSRGSFRKTAFLLGCEPERGFEKEKANPLLVAYREASLAERVVVVDASELLLQYAMDLSSRLLAVFFTPTSSPQTSSRSLSEFASFHQFALSQKSFRNSQS